MLIILILSSIFLTANSTTYTCLACTVAVGEIKRWAGYYETGVVDIMEFICDLIPSKEEKWRDDCKELIAIFGPLIIDLLEEGLSPDVTCRKLGMCDGYENCTLYPNYAWQKSFHEKKKPPSAILPFALLSLLPDGEKLGLGRFGSKGSNDDPGPVPTEHDFDQDYFATGYYDRGAAWRGRDCDDKNKNIYPGKKEAMDGVDPTTDYNCNGISGTDPTSGKPYEEVLCPGTRRGVVAIGDSACAHFRIPQQLIYANVTLEMAAQVMPLVELEADWPQLSTFTAFQNDTTGLTPGRVDSIYIHLVERNKCNHRDYQNLCVNGGSSKKLMPQVQAMTRDHDSDHPIVFFIMTIGDDVCHSEEGFSDFTTPEQFYDNIVGILDYLDDPSNGRTAPPGSHVVFVSLVDGTMLYKYLWNRTHPLGMTYEEVYSYMICTQCNPCWGWLNPNETVREITQEKANDLSAMYPKIINDKNYTNFDMTYIDLPTVEHEILDEWIAHGRDPAQLVEPFDGFHPGQPFQALLAEHIYDILIKKDPDFFGDLNPNNAQIVQLFGDQGGY